jgi:drug/metabolite transporter (DMT)-like permease
LPEEMSEMKILIFCMIIFMTMLGASAGFFLKKASGKKGLKEMLLNINLYIGGILYLVSALINIAVLRYMDYSVVLPLTSITYIWTMLISYFVLKEKITRKKIIGICAVVCGAVLLVL